MDVIALNKIYQIKIKSFFLVFFCVSLLFSCQNKYTESIKINYSQNGAAKSVLFSGETDANYQIKLKGKKNAIFGELVVKNNENIFTPIIPFSTGQSYEIYKNEILYQEFSIPKLENQIHPKLTTIYPNIDTVPENLLKMYFVFDKPMQQSKRFLDFVSVTNNKTKTIENIFLSLENELWNKEYTELTLWLDPGRIKKDLIPNKELGIPIKEGNTYEITILKNLSDAEGAELGKDYKKTIVVGSRDVQSPATSKWKLTIPQKNTKEALGISFGETLDAMLAQETLEVVNEKGEHIDGGFMLSKKATSMLFVPKNLWNKGMYSIVIESRLEDLAGNNLNRLFDTDLSKGEKISSSKAKTLEFMVQ